MPAGREYHGQVTFGGLPTPGATVTATQGSTRLVTITDQQGLYSFPDLADGKWTIEVEMTGFSVIKQDVVIGPNAPAGRWELKLLPLDQIKAQIVGARHDVPLHAEPGAPSVQPLVAYVSFYRAQTKAFETAPMAVTDGLNNRLKTMPLSFSIAINTLPPGEYDCQVTVLDPTGEKGAFWRAPVMLVP